MACIMGILILWLPVKVCVELRFCGDGLWLEIYLRRWRVVRRRLRGGDNDLRRRGDQAVAGRAEASDPAERSRLSRHGGGGKGRRDIHRKNELIWRILRRQYIEKLQLDALIGLHSAGITALACGGLYGVLAAALNIFCEEKRLRVKKRELRINPCYEGAKIKFRLRCMIRLRLWDIICGIILKEAKHG